MGRAPVLMSGEGGRAAGARPAAGLATACARAGRWVGDACCLGRQCCGLTPSCLRRCVPAPPTLGVLSSLRLAPVARALASDAQRP